MSSQNYHEEIEIILLETDYYKILNISKSSTTEEIRKSYKKQAIKYHPDKNKHEKAPEVFKKVSHAFSVLSNPEKKKNYDTYGDEEGPQVSSHSNRYHFNTGFDPFDLFQQMFEQNEFSSFSYSNMNINGTFTTFSSFVNGMNVNINGREFSFNNANNRNSNIRNKAGRTCRTNRNNRFNSTQYFDEEEEESSEEESDEEGDVQYFQDSFGNIYVQKNRNTKNTNLNRNIHIHNPRSSRHTHTTHSTNSSNNNSNNFNHSNFSGHSYNRNTAYSNFNNRAQYRNNVKNNTNRIVGFMNTLYSFFKIIMIFFLINYLFAFNNILKRIFNGGK